MLLASAEPHSKGMAACVEEDVYTTGQAARILKVTDRGVRKMRDRGELEVRRVRPGGRPLRRCASDLERPPGTLTVTQNDEAPMNLNEVIGSTPATVSQELQAEMLTS